MKLHVTAPIRTKAGQNNREHHMVRHRRVKQERSAVAWALVTHRGPPPSTPVVVTLTRCSPTTGSGLDSDNLQGSLKAVRDQVAMWLGRDDGDPSVDWRYEQRTRASEWAVEIQVESK